MKLLISSLLWFIVSALLELGKSNFTVDFVVFTNIFLANLRRGKGDGVYDILNKFLSLSTTSKGISSS